MAEAAAAILPFTIGSRVNERQSLTFPNVPLASASTTVPQGAPGQIPAVGFLKTIRLEVTGTATGGTPSFQADAPFNVIASIAVKNSAGNYLIAPMSGYELYLINKYGGMGAGLTSAYGSLSDPKAGRQYSAVAATGFHFFLDLAFEIDPTSGLGAIPALASNRSYQVELTLAAITSVWSATTPPTAVSVTIDMSSIYWDVPNASSANGQGNATEPFGLGTLSMWQKENPIVAPNEQLTKLNNVGNALRNHIFIARTAAGVRTDTDWTAILEIFVDNNPLLRLKKTEWQDNMVRWFGYDAAALDTAKGLDTGVYTLPWFLLAGGLAGDPANPRSQYLPTLDATLLQLHGLSWGSNISQLTVINQAIYAPNAGFIYSK